MDRQGTRLSLRDQPEPEVSAILPFSGTYVDEMIAPVLTAQ